MKETKTKTAQTEEENQILERFRTSFRPFAAYRNRANYIYCSDEYCKKVIVRGHYNSSYYMQIYIARQRAFHSLTLLLDKKVAKKIGLVFPVEHANAQYFRILTIRRPKLVDCIKIMESEMPVVDAALRKQEMIPIINSIMADYIRYTKSGKKTGINLYPLNLDDLKDGPALYVMLAKYIDRLPERIKKDMFQYYHPAIGLTPSQAAEYTSGSLIAETEPRDPLDVNAHLLDGIKYFAETYRSYDEHELSFTEAEQMSLIEKSVYTPVDAYMWPLDLEPPDITPSLVASVGPKATSGGLDREGRTVLKTNCYYDSITGFLDILELAKRDLPLPIQPLLWSFKNETIKYNKKLRLFTVTQFITNIGEQLVFGPMLNATKNTVVSDAGGTRIMNGATLDRGYGSVLLDKMLKRNGITEGLKAPNIEQKKSVNTDYSYFEYQHHVKQIIIARSTYYYFYNNDIKKPNNKLYIKLQAWLQETYIQIDVDVGAHEILHFRPGAFGSGILLTLDCNGKINKTNLELGAYNIVYDIVEKAREANRTITDEEKIKIEGVKKVVGSTAVQGDDGYNAGDDDVINGMHDIVTEIAERYGNDIKIESGPLLAKFDSSCYNTNHARDFLKLVPVKTKKGIFFIRPTEDALIRIVMPNNPGFNAATQYHSAISQMIQSAGNKVTYDIAKGKHDLIVSFMRKEKLQITNRDKEESLAQLTKHHKGEKVIDFLTVSGFQELTFNEVNKKFLDYDHAQIYQNIRNATYFEIYHVNYDFYQNSLNAAINFIN